jgi:farnesyl diphosphate synthase
MMNKLITLQNHTNDYLKSILSGLKIPAEKIHQALHYVVFPGGKRLRPVLVYLVGDILALPLSILNPIAAAIELIHCYSLVHDDLPAMDDDDLRRGKPTCHKKFNEATAILVGDGIQSLAIEVLLTKLSSLMDPDKIIALTQVILQASGIQGMVSGQSLDLSRLNSNHVTQDELTNIHKLKTGYLINACIYAPIKACNKVDSTLEQSLCHFAQTIGISFQIQDDYLDCYGSTNQLGKQKGSDLANEKTTFATILPKDELKKLINSSYEQAIDYLTPFSNISQELIQFVNYLRLRSH